MAQGSFHQPYDVSIYNKDGGKCHWLHNALTESLSDDDAPVPLHYWTG